MPTADLVQEYAVMQALKPPKDWEPLVGWIESLTIDERRFYFCMCGDDIISPLVSEVEQVVDFATACMKKTDGKRHRREWREEAELSVEYSELSDTRDFFTKDFRALKRGLHESLRHDKVCEGIFIDHHQLWLLASSTGWGEITIPSEHLAIADALYADEGEWLDCISRGIRVLSGNKARPKNASCREIARLIVSCFHTLKKHVPENWNLLLDDIL